VVLSSILNNRDEVFMVEDMGDGDEGTGMGQIRDELELGVIELRYGAIKFGQVK
jgi:hypothetical protein